MTKKIGVSLPDDLYAWMQARVAEGKAESISGLITEVMASQRQLTELAALVADLKEEFGEPSPEDKAWAQAAIERARLAREGRLPADEQVA
ncbi:toxin-antitoxin system antitoxin subunit [Nonomuraea africana]|uniref:Arc/MetJ-type ribon-helix-helix transcriptional regulator n=1 Tax=Nonomuraea africana TaxID=46171 RepID=A0ABR9KLM1_9ACTN|nr:toxin-antitoxin system antitoxin subunit [Nonomuraea africana]MBE1562927.1 Arc/MetJ-type ribon-helix-helix transcriptional regulator [Nonomuraea africana]